MSYNLKNKIVVMFAVAFSLALVNNVKAQEAEVLDMPQVATEEVQPAVVEGSADTAATQEPTFSEEDPFGLDDPMAETEDDLMKSQEGRPLPNLNAKTVEENTGPEPQALDFNDNNANANATTEGVPDVNLDTALPDVSIDTSSKTPFEKYGNTILSRVDNDLFNQMSEIEKQTTLLNLELKREEVKNRIDALKAQRERAKQEELDRAAEREKKARDEELQRQKALLQEQMLLKEKEMELEKIRQAKILNEYMNEMLIANQQWVEANTKLTAQIKKLQEERLSLIAEIETRLEGLNERANKTGQLAEETRVAYERKVSSLNKQIEGLRQVINEKEAALQNMANGSDNPFAGVDVIDENAVDMSKEYAIMDITGKGDNIVAKIVSQDGTTFTVRKGSVLKGGEVVVNISDNFITFENHGAKSYLYTGGTVMQYEPTESFNDAPKTPEIAVGPVVSAPEIRNVRGAPNNNTANLKEKVKTTVEQPTANKTETRSVSTSSSSRSTKNRSTKNSSGGGIASFSQGMMVK